MAQINCIVSTVFARILNLFQTEINAFCVLFLSFVMFYDIYNFSPAQWNHQFCSLSVTRHRFSNIYFISFIRLMDENSANCCEWIVWIHRHSQIIQIFRLNKSVEKSEDERQWKEKVMKKSHAQLQSQMNQFPFSVSYFPQIHYQTKEYLSLSNQFGVRFFSSSSSCVCSALITDIRVLRSIRGW